jgi:two-component sensor histidine kinase/PAS domain-containing protein
MEKSNKTLNKIFFSLMSQNKSGIIVSDIDGNILWSNSESGRIFGYSEAEMTALSIGAFGLSIDPVKIVDFVGRDGKKITVRQSVQTTNWDGKTWCLITLIDITSIESIKIDRNQKNRNTPVKTDTAAVNIWSIDSDFHYTFFNENHKAAMKEVWGAKISLGSFVLDYLKASDYKEQVESIYKKMLRGKPHRSVDHFTKPSGEEKYYENFGHPIQNTEDEIIGLMFYTVDITGKMEVENRLKLTISLLESVMNSPEDLHIHSIDTEYRYLFYNNAHKTSMEEVWQTSPEIGRDIFELLPDPEHRKRVKIFFDRSINGEVISDVSEIVDKNGNKQYYNNISAPINNSEDKIVGITIFVLNITDRITAEQKIRKSLKEKEFLLKEIHHRVKNNIQMITSMINLQKDLVEDKNAQLILQDSLSRISTMGLIHQALYQGENLTKIRMEDYCGNLLTTIMEFYNSEKRQISINSKFDDISLEIDQAIPVGLIINELITNSMKYAFQDNKQGKINLKISSTSGDEIHLRVSDNGRGMPDGVDTSQTETLGLQLLDIFVKQLNGRLTIDSDDGFKADIYFQES